VLLVLRASKALKVALVGTELQVLLVGMVLKVPSEK
jgi:hypothetical protein